MGARGPLAKPVEARQGHGDLVIAEVFDDALEIPTPPEQLHPAVARQWDVFWVSEVAHVLAASDLPAVERLFLYRSEWWETHDIYAGLAYTAGPEVEDDAPLAAKLVLGSAKQLTLHPLAKRLLELESAIDKLETQLGLTPMARARLGIAIGTQKLTWQQVAAGSSPATLPAGAGISDTEELGV